MPLITLKSTGKGPQTKVWEAGPYNAAAFAKEAIFASGIDPASEEAIPAYNSFFLTRSIEAMHGKRGEQLVAFKTEVEKMQAMMKKIADLGFNPPYLTGYWPVAELKLRDDILAEVKAHKGALDKAKANKFRKEYRDLEAEILNVEEATKKVKEHTEKCEKQYTHIITRRREPQWYKSEADLMADAEAAARGKHARYMEEMINNFRDNFAMETAREAYYAQHAPMAAPEQPPWSSQMQKEAPRRHRHRRRNSSYTSSSSTASPRPFQWPA